MIAAAGGLLLAGLIAFMVSPKLGILALGLPLAPLLVLAPDKMVLLVIAALPFDAVASIGPPGTFTLTRMLGIAVTGGWVANVLVRRRRIEVTIPTLLLLAFVAFAAFSVMWADDQSAGWRRLRTIVQLLLLYLMVSNLLRTPAQIARALDALLGAAAIVALIVLWQFPSMEQMERATLRFGEDQFNPNYLAATLVVPAVLAIGLGALRRTRKWGWLPWAATAPIGVAIILTGSRGGIVGLAVGLTVLGMLRPRIGIRAAAAALLILSALPLIAPRSYVDRVVARFSSVSEDRLSGRLDIWHVGLTMVRNHPVHGVGLGNFGPAFYRHMEMIEVDPAWAISNYRRNRGAHNMYLGICAELGLLGGGLFLCALAAHGVFGLRTLRTAVRERWEACEPIAVAVLAGFITMVILGLNTDLTVQKQPWFVLGIVHSVGLLSQTSPSRARA